MAVRLSRETLRWVVVVILLAAAAAFFIERQQALVERAQEDVAYFFDPSAKRALAYGIKHFDAPHPQEYDLTRAERFFTDAVRKDPNLPYAHYELARIAFLRSNFAYALGLVNQEFALNNNIRPEYYYVRALIEGYMGDYANAAKDYEEYFKIAPANWAAINDYSWVLLKDDLPEGAHEALSWGLKQWPENPWLLANEATALYEMKRYSDASVMAKKAVPAVNALTVQDWLIAYPGNDPLIAPVGLDNFKKSTQENLSKILAKVQ